MSSEVTTPLRLTTSFGEITTSSPVDTVSTLRLNLTGGFVLNGPGTGTTLSELDLSSVSRLTRNVPIVERSGAPTMQFQLLFQRVLEAIEAAVNSLNTQVNSNTSIIAALQATSALAQAANDNAQSVDSRVSVQGSYTNPTKVLTASAAGVVTIAAHSRRYVDEAQTSVSVDAGSVSGLMNERQYTIYYVDAGRQGGAVSYQATENAVAQTGNVHVVGSVTIPATGSPDASGTSPTAPGVAPPPPESVPQGYEDFQ